MIKTNINDTTVVKVICGDCVGTAFFVTSELLLTARHNVIHSKTDDEHIHIHAEEKVYSAEILHEHIALSGDICILRISEYTALSYLPCLSMPMRKGDKYTFMGYPQTILGQVVGSIVEVEIHISRDTFHATEGFDCTATIIGNFMPSQFSGFSGSPIYNDEGLVIGVVTHKLDGCIGFISVLKILDILTKHSVICESDYTKYDKSPYSKFTNRKKIAKAINMAGPRYMRDIHVPTNRFDKYFEYAIKTSFVNQKLTEYKESLAEIQTIIEHTSLPIFESDKVDFKKDLLESIKGLDISSNDSYMSYLMDILNNNLSERNKDRGKVEVNYNELNEFSKKWHYFYNDHCELNEDIDKYYSLSTSSK